MDFQKGKKFALVTGASSGIGWAMALNLAERGYGLIVVARRLERLKELEKKVKSLYKTKVYCIQADITKPKDMKELENFILDFKEPLQILVNNAGKGSYSAFKESERRSQVDILDLNIRALVVLSHICIPVLEKNDVSYILNVGSSAGFVPGPFMAVYYASKSFVLYFTEALDEEMKIRNAGLRVSVLCPGPTKSEFGEVAGFKRGGKSFLEKRFTNHADSIPSSEQVAEYGLEKMFEGKRIIIDSLGLKIVLFLTRLSPRSMITSIVGKIQGKSKQQN